MNLEHAKERVVMAREGIASKHAYPVQLSTHLIESESI